MKTDLKAKYIQHLINKKNSDEGFTLIELLVVIIIIGILSAIALPSFLNQANKARESEAKQYIGSLNRGQQAYFLQEQEFSSALTNLELGIASVTQNYSYAVVDGGVDSTAVTNVALPFKGANATVRAYQGGVNTGTLGAGGEATTTVVLCEGLKTPVGGGTAGGEAAVYSATAAPTCNAAYKAID